MIECDCQCISVICNRSFARLSTDPVPLLSFFHWTHSSPLVVLSLISDLAYFLIWHVIFFAYSRSFYLLILSGYAIVVLLFYFSCSTSLVPLVPLLLFYFSCSTSLVLFFFSFLSFSIAYALFLPSPSRSVTLMFLFLSFLPSDSILVLPY